MERKYGLLKVIFFSFMIILVLLFSNLTFIGAQEIEKFTVCTSIPIADPQSVPYLSIGKEFGWFEEEGIDVTIQRVPPPVGLANVQQGNAWAAMADLSSLMINASKGKSFNMAMAYHYYSRPIYAVATMTDSPIKDVKQLKGKKIGVEFVGPPLVPFVEQWLKIDGGFTMDDVDIVSPGVGIQGAEVLRRGDIDAYVSLLFLFANWENLGYDFAYLPTPTSLEMILGPGWCAPKKILEDPVKGKLLAKFCKVFAKQICFTKANPELAVKIFWKHTPEARPDRGKETEFLKRGLHVLEVLLPYIYKTGDTWGGPVTKEEVETYAKLLGIFDNYDNWGEFASYDYFLDIVNDWDEEEVISLAKSYKLE